MLNLPPGITRMSELLSEGVSTTQEGQTRLTCVNEVHHNLHKADYNFDSFVCNSEHGIRQQHTPYMCPIVDC